MIKIGEGGRELIGDEGSYLPNWCPIVFMKL